MTVSCAAVSALPGDSIDTMDPQSPEDFDRLKDALAKKLTKYEVSWFV